MFLILDDAHGDDHEEKITDRYNLSNEIGKGNFAVVYLGKKEHFVKKKNFENSDKIV